MDFDDGTKKGKKAKKPAKLGKKASDPGTSAVQDPVRTLLLMITCMGSINEPAFRKMQKQRRESACLSTVTVLRARICALLGRCQETNTSSINSKILSL